MPKSKNADARTGLYIGDASAALEALSKLDGQTKSAIIRRLVLREARASLGESHPALPKL